MLRVDEKNLREHYVFNVLGVLITTNHKTDGIYLPADDRRHYVAWSNLHQGRLPDGILERAVGLVCAPAASTHVAAYLTEFDLSAFDPKAPPPKTPAFWDIVNASRAPEDDELADMIDALNNPDALHFQLLIAAATGDIAEWLMDRKNRRALPHRLERCGYVSVQNPDAKDGMWKSKGERLVIYAKVGLTPAGEGGGSAETFKGRRPVRGGRRSGGS